MLGAARRHRICGELVGGDRPSAHLARAVAARLEAIECPFDGGELCLDLAEKALRLGDDRVDRRRRQLTWSALGGGLRLVHDDRG